ncbi:transporter [Dongia soli]|uniref:Transporter n=1 Tax=Dongia soli TaxID=600628 RepID=A0ABU5E8U4_9PROT|nr:transporter [Dongia soli]MDY0882775.1 transporter [Dongia soli]
MIKTSFYAAAMSSSFLTDRCNNRIGCVILMPRFRMSKIGPYIIIALVVDGFVFARPRSAAAEQWLLEPVMQQQLKYDDNLLLSPGGNSAYGSISTPEIKLSRLGDQLQLVLDGQFRFSRYFNRSEFNSDDQFLYFNGTYLNSERSTFHLDANFKHDTSLNSDLNDSGKFLGKKIRVTSWNITPSWEYLLSELDTLDLAAGYNQVDYSSNQLTSYKNYFASSTFIHQISEISDVTATLDYQRFEPDDEENINTNTVGFLVGYRYHPTERLEIGAGVGANYTAAENSGNNDVGYRIKFNGKYQLNDQTNLTADFSHDREPSSDGVLVTRNRVKASASYRLDPLVTLSVSGTYYDNSDPLSVSGSSNNNNQEEDVQSYAFGPSIAWQFSQSWSLVGNYTYRHKVSGDDHEKAHSNAVFVTLKYSPVGFSWSE